MDFVHQNFRPGFKKGVTGGQGGFRPPLSTIRVKAQDKEEKDSASVAEISIVQKILASHWSVDELLNCDLSKLLILIQNL